MAYQDFTTWIEGADTGGALSQTASRATFTALELSDDAYLYKDFSAGHFDGDFEHLFEILLSIQGSDATVFAYLLANVPGSFQDVHGAGGPTLCVSSTSFFIFHLFALQETEGVDVYQDAWINAQLNTLYFITVERDESVGSFGTAYLYIRTGSHDGALQYLVTVALHTSKKDFRYLEATTGFHVAGSNPITGYVQNLDLQEPEEVGITLTQIGRGFARGNLRGLNRGAV